MFCRRPFSWPELRPLLFACALCALPGLALPSAATSLGDCEFITPESKVRVVLSHNQPRRSFCFSANKGQFLTVETSNYGDTIPSASVIAPSGEVDGGPGRIVYRGNLKESGVYRIDMGQRGMPKNGAYDFTVHLK